MRSGPWWRMRTSSAKRTSDQMRWWRWIIGAGVVGGIGVVAATIAWPIGAPVSDLTLQGDAQPVRIRGGRTYPAWRPRRTISESMKTKMV